MSSNLIDVAQRRALEKFFRRVLLPLGEDPQMPPFPAGSQTSPDSYFVVRAAPTLGREDFELKTADETQVTETLTHQWAQTPLEQIIKPMLKLCRRFPEVQEKSEVSSFVYEMF